MPNRSATLVRLAIPLLFAACSVERASGEDRAATTAATAGSAYHIDVVPTAPIQPGTDADLTIRVLDAANAPVTSFMDVHTEKMHFVAVSSDLQTFEHVHPALGAQGIFTVQAPFAVAQPYDVFAEYQPAGAGDELVSRAKLTPVGATNVAPNLARFPAFDGRTELASTSTDGTTKIVLRPLAHGMLMPGMPTTLEIAVQNPDGSAATDLVDWLGMPGHAIVLSEDTSTFIHAHAMQPGMGDMDGGMGDMDGGMAGMDPMGGGNATPVGTNVLDIAITFPKAGRYKMFVQVERGNDVLTVPFVLRVMNM